MRFLIVEDDADTARIIALTLEVTFPGSHSRIVADGKSALDEFDQENDDLVILDLGLPQVDGFAVCRRITESSDVPVIMVTGRDLVSDKVAGLSQGADDYIVKPFTTLEFVARVQAVLRRSGKQKRVRQPVVEHVAEAAIDGGHTFSDRLLEYLQQHPEGVPISTLERITGVDGMEFVRLVATLIDAHHVRDQNPLLFAVDPSSSDVSAPPRSDSKTGPDDPRVEFDASPEPTPGIGVFSKDPVG